MVRPDFALQMMLRTMRGKGNLHENPDWQIILSAVQELQRLYKVEEWAIDLLAHYENEGRRDSDLAALRELLDLSQAMDDLA